MLIAKTNFTMHSVSVSCELPAQQIPSIQNAGPGGIGRFEVDSLI
jgi:hypothetical protein